MIRAINTLVLLFTCIAAGSLSAEIYRTQDAEGNIIFTDTPVEKAEKVELPDVTTFKSQPYQKITPGKKAPADPAKTYKVTLVSPADKETVRDNNGNIPIEVEVSPALKREHGHQLLVWLDDQKPVRFTTSRYQLSNIDRGTHTVSVKVVDGRGKTLSATLTHEVYVKRHSVNFNPRPTPRTN